MQQSPFGQPQTSIKEIDFKHYISHYANLFWRKKWHILITAIIVILLTIIAGLRFVPRYPRMTVSAIIGLDNQNSLGATAVSGISVNSDIQLLRRRNFLRNISNDLSLQLVLPENRRADIFDSVFVSETAPPGEYVFTIDNTDNSFKITYTNNNLGFKEKIVESGSLITLKTISFSDIHLVFNEQFLTSPFKFDFYIITQRFAVEGLLHNLNITPPDIRNRQNFIILRYAGTDYNLITDIANHIADEYVKQNLQFKKRRSSLALDVLEKQLVKAEEQLRKSDAALKTFRSANPTIGLNLNTQQTITNITDAEMAGQRLANLVEDAKKLESQFSEEAASIEDKIETIREVLFFLEGGDVTTAPVLQENLSHLIREREQFEQNLAPNHPKAIENKNQIDRIGRKSLNALNEYVNETKSKITRSKSSMSSLMRELRTLPKKELRLAELERDQQINSDIYSNVLSQYNEVKVANSVEMADLFIMDYAVPPIPPSNKFRLIKILVTALFLGFLLSFGPIIGFDLVDKTVRTETELSKMTKTPVLQSIPLITKPSIIESSNRSNYKENNKSPENRRLDPNLISTEDTPNYIKEIFRSLRTKISLSLHDAKEKTIVVTSLNMNEGKSTIISNLAITLAQQGNNTLLIDGDIRRGVIHNSFVKNKRPGLSDYLLNVNLKEELDYRQIIQQTHIKNLNIISSGKNMQNPPDFLSNEKFGNLIKKLSENYDYILMDSPPLAIGSDTIVVSSYFSKYIVVTKAGSTDIIELKKRLEEYRGVKDKVIGLILNFAIIDKKIQYYKYSEYY